MNACTCIWHHREFPGIPPMGRGYLHEIIIFTTHACVCMHVHVCGAPPTTPTPIHPPPTPRRAAGSQKYQNSITLELIEIIRFCLKILYLWTFLNSYRPYLITPDTPHPSALPSRTEETQITRIAITLEWIEIIQFCLKIWDPWTVLHTYRLGLMCRLGGVLFQMVLLCFWCKKVLLWPSNKKFSCFCTGSH